MLFDDSIRQFSKNSTTDRIKEIGNLQHISISILKEELMINPQNFF